MPITITTLADEGAVANSFSLVSSDRTSSEWLNVYDIGHDCRIFIRQQLTKKDKVTGLQNRRALVQIIGRKVVPGSNPIRYEQIVTNLTIVVPLRFEALDLQEVKDHSAFLRNFLTAANTEKLVQGMP